MRNQPLPLLIATGIFLGLNFPIGKWALGQGVAPAVWAAFICLCAGLAMLVVSAITAHRAHAQSPVLAYAFTSGFLSFVMPNLLTFTVIPKIGSGLAGVMFALSPPATALLSWIFGVRPPDKWGMLGIVIGLCGAMLIVLGRGGGLDGQGGAWIFAGLLVPVFLGLGNVYRTSFWPKGASTHALAAYTNLAAVPFLLVAAILIGGKIDLAPLFQIPVIAALQATVSASMFLMFFRLQQIGGPTYLSQIGYVAAALGLVIGVVWFHEAYPPMVWLGAGIIAAGIAVTTIAGAKT
ncbi:MAG: DMT family transporter [Alphaproteobacteria bacterium]|nr:DMT family transporter [Alphaproteobacteria bacterium]